VSSQFLLPMVFIGFMRNGMEVERVVAVLVDVATQNGVDGTCATPTFLSFVVSLILL
jgi:hypothetical protein